MRPLGRPAGGRWRPGSRRPQGMHADPGPAGRRWTAVDTFCCVVAIHPRRAIVVAGRKSRDGTGQDGYRLAAEYVSAHFKELGVKALGEDGSYYQTVPWQQTKVAKAEMTFTLNGKTILAVAPQRMSGRVSTSAEANGNVALLNIEIPPTEGRGRPRIQGLEELEAANLEGKVVVAVVRTDRNGIIRYV